MYDKETLLNASHMAKYISKNGGYYKGVISKNEQEGRLVNHCLNRSIITVSCFDTSVPKDQPARSIYFFTDDHCFGVGVLPEGFVPCTSVFPHSVCPRPGLEDGLVDTLDKYIEVYHKNDTRIESIDELVEFLNKQISGEENA